MKKKVVRIGNLNRLHVHPLKPNKGVGPCGLELSAVLNCWHNSGGPDTADCKAFVSTLANCMRSYVYSPRKPRFQKADIFVAKASSSTINCQLPSVLLSESVTTNSSGRLGSIR